MPHPLAPHPSPTITYSALLSSVSPSLSVAFYPTCVQFFISGSIFLTLVSLPSLNKSSLPVLSSSTSLSISHELNMPPRGLATCRSSRENQRNVRSCGCSRKCSHQSFWRLIRGDPSVFFVCVINVKAAHMQLTKYIIHKKSTLKAFQKNDLKSQGKKIKCQSASVNCTVRAD